MEKVDRRRLSAQYFLVKPNGFLYVRLDAAKRVQPVVFGLWYCSVYCSKKILNLYHFVCFALTVRFRKYWHRVSAQPMSRGRDCSKETQSMAWILGSLKQCLVDRRQKCFPGFIRNFLLFFFGCRIQNSINIELICSHLLYFSN